MPAGGLSFNPGTLSRCGRSVGVGTLSDKLKDSFAVLFSAWASECDATKWALPFIGCKEVFA
jgi:hypothetical protein